MGSYQDLRNILQHINDVEHNPDAWKAGLTPQQVADVNGWLKSDHAGYHGYTDPQTHVYYADRSNNNIGNQPQVPDDALDRLRNNHAGLFNSNKAPITPTTPPPPAPGAPAPDAGAPEPTVPTDEQNKGEAAKAAKTLEDKLRSNTDKAVDADRELARALLAAHATTADGAKRLNDIQKEIDTAVHSATTLDTSMGAREFQRFLNSKYQEIADVLKNAKLDAASQKEVLAALSEFYATRKTGSANDDDGSQSDNGGTGGHRDNGGDGDNQQQPPDDLGGGEGDLGDYGLGAADPAPGAAQNPALQAATGAASQIPGTLAGVGSAIPGALGGVGSAIPGLIGGTGAGGKDGGMGDLFGQGKPEHDKPKDGSDFADMFNEPFGPDNGPDNGGSDGDNNGHGHHGNDHDGTSDPNPGTANPAVPAGQNPAAASGPTTVTIKDGDGKLTVTADNPQLAGVLTDIDAGKSPLDAYRAHDIAITTGAPKVALDADQLRTGDYASYSNGGIAVVINGQKVWLDGHVQPIAAAMKTGFLGWQHPPAPTTTPAAAALFTPPPQATGNTTPTAAH